MTGHGVGGRGFPGLGGLREKAASAVVAPALAVSVAGLLALGVGIGTDLATPVRHRADAVLLVLPGTTSPDTRTAVYASFLRGDDTAAYAGEVAAAAESVGDPGCTLDTARAPGTSAITVTAECGDPSAAVAAVVDTVAAALAVPSRGLSVLVRPDGAAPRAVPVPRGPGPATAVGLVSVGSAALALPGVLGLRRAGRSRPGPATGRP